MVHCDTLVEITAGKRPVCIESSRRGLPIQASTTTTVTGSDAASGSCSSEAAEAKLCQAAARYRPLAKCLDRLDDLRRRQRRRQAQRWLAGLVLRLTEVPQRLACRPGAVRFVALSDTHRYHEAVELPQGEVLLYAGDSVGNYGRSSDLSQQFTDFLAWLSVQSRRFAHVFFIAGNHETFLDDQQGDTSLAIAQLQGFLDSNKNCTYLNNTAAVYRGIRMFGSPITVSRVETEGKKYYSRAFERLSEQRVALWAQLPEGLDLLMTHCPPSGRLCSQTVGDPLLAARLASMLKPPHFHIFGHDHCFLGVDFNEQTVFLNVAQDECLRLDPHGGGCALILDIEARDQNAVVE